MVEMDKVFSDNMNNLGEEDSADLASILPFNAMQKMGHPTTSSLSPDSTIPFFDDASFFDDFIENVYIQHFSYAEIFYVIQSFEDWARGSLKPNES